MPLSSTLLPCFLLVALGVTSINAVLTEKKIPISYQEYLEVPTQLRKPSYKSHGQRLAMGISDPSCDDAKVELEVDFNFNDTVAYTCQSHEAYPLVTKPESTRAVECLETIPKSYSPRHYCMNDRVDYYQRIPTFQGHRPNWAQFGEYKYCPPQRWLHDIEHGSVVFLYHPCADKDVVSEFSNLIRSCIRKHVITPSRRLRESHPFALVAWGCSLEMTGFSRQDVIDFVRQYGLRGPEAIDSDGKYNVFLIRPATIPKGSDVADSVLCPNM